MSFPVELTDAAERDLKRLDTPVRRRILMRLEWLGRNAEQVRHQSLAGELEGLFKLRIGDYRVLYDLNASDKVILVHVIDHRREVYRKK